MPDHDAPNPSAQTPATPRERELLERVRLLERANSHLAEAKEFFEHTLDRIGDPIFVKDAKHRFIYVNEALCALLGASRSEVLGKSDVDFFPKEQVDVFWSNDTSVLETGRQSVNEETLTDAQGETRHIITQKNLYRGKFGKPFVVGIIRDLTNLKKTQESLRAAERFLARLLENIPAAVHVTRSDGRIRLVNRAWEELTGITAQEAVGRPVEEVFPAETARFSQFNDQAARGSTVTLEQYGDFQGERRHFHTVKFPLYDEAGTLEAVGSISMEVTRLTRAKEALRESARASEAANRAKSELLANMSHELRTPISAILGLAELSHHIGVPEKTAGHLSLITKSARSLLSIIDDVLDLSAMQSGQLALQQEEFALADVLDNVLGPFREVCRDKGLTFMLETPPDLPAKLLGDPARLRQVLTHLLGNAVKFTSQGGITLLMSAQPSSASGRVRMHFVVRDTGIGVAPKDAQRIFESFRQGDASFSKAFQGAGLGLTLCRDLAILMGGEVWLESSPGQGSAFHFTAVFGQTRSLAQPKPAAKPQPGPPPRGARVLVAEDNPINSHVFQEFLVSQGHHVSLAVDGAQALEQLAAAPFDLVFMDVQMPGMDGLEAVRRIRQGECGAERANTPVVALTGYAMPGDRERFLQAGMTGYLAKPIQLTSLLDMLSIHAGATERGRRAPAADIQAAYRPLIKDFIRFVRERSGQLQKALTAGDVAGAAKAAHDIKGTSMAFGAKGVNALGAEMERALADDGSLGGATPSEVRRLLDSLERELAALEESLAEGQG